LGAILPARPFVVAIGGSVASGKSRFAEALSAAVELGGGATAAVTHGDSFLRANHELAAAGLLARKGFPESFDGAALAAFRAAVQLGRAEIVTPVYSHEAYDILPGETRRLERPEVLIFEGVQALATPPGAARLHDFGVYIEASEADLEAWYVERFVALRRHEAPALAERAQALASGGPETLALEIWRETNLANLGAHIAPTKVWADLIIDKAGDHRVQALRLRV
jgi:type I pantothenate kinase